eukprot:TRINITY_DN1219_c0_g1_i1.p1 TRINITY_DN1219_c0_g1~~TRINITY_DN1219_c0_g1_i1.p1  ORF type:complete len:680 (-),score=198.96 TRINITY_DN1219_c0_g1_i1:59-2098(-)
MSTAQVAPASFVWEFNDRQVGDYRQYFQTFDTDKDGFIQAAEVKDMFLKSGISVTDLAVIWELSDADKDGKLSESEFIVAVFLIWARKQGVELPKQLPDSLLKTLKDPKPEGGSTADDDDSDDSSDEDSESASLGQPSRSQLQRMDTMTPKVNYAIPSSQLEVYKQIFAQNSKDGFIGGAQAFEMFTKSGLANDQLAHIWELSDMDLDSQLSQQEFLVAMHLITLTRAGNAIPESTPAELVASASSTPRTAAKTETKSPMNTNPNAGTPTSTNNTSAHTSVVPTSAPATMPTIPVPQLPPTPLQPLTPEYSAAQDIQNLDNFFTDILNAQKFAGLIENDTSLARTEVEKQRAISETFEEKFAFRQQRVALLNHQKQQFQAILGNFAGQLRAEEEELSAAQHDLRNLWQIMEVQQREFNDPNFDFNVLRSKRKNLEQQYNGLRSQYKLGNDEYIQLVKEIEMLKNDLENRDTDQSEFEAQFKNIQNEQQNVSFTSNDAFFNQDQEEAQKDAELDEYYTAYFGNKDKMQKAFTADPNADVVIRSPTTTNMPMDNSWLSEANQPVKRRGSVVHGQIPGPNGAEANPFGKRPPGSPTTRKEKVKDHFDLQAQAVKYEIQKEKTKKQRKAEEKARKKAEKDAKKQAKKEKKKGGSGSKRRGSNAPPAIDVPPDQVRGSSWDPFK